MLFIMKKLHGFTLWLDYLVHVDGTSHCIRRLSRVEGFSATCLQELCLCRQSSSCRDSRQLMLSRPSPFFWVLQNAVQMPSKRGHLRRNLPKVSTRRNKSRPCRWEQCLCELFAFRLEFWGVFHVAQGGRMDSFFAALYCTFCWNTPLCHMPRIEPR